MIQPGDTAVMNPVGYFRCCETYPYDVPRQGILAGDNQGRILLNPGMGFEQAVTELGGFSRIWVIFLFHRNNTWKPMVRPPRHRERKVGVFASRAPYRPNSIGMSCVKLVQVRGLEITVAQHDLLDGTPILDIKPYIPYADSFPDAMPGWTAEGENAEYEIDFTSEAELECRWLEEHGVPCLRQFISDRLCTEPLNNRRNRLIPAENGYTVLAYRTWRVVFMANTNTRHILIQHLCSGYTDAELSSESDVYGDKQIHRDFRALFS